MSEQPQQPQQPKTAQSGNAIADPLVQMIQGIGDTVRREVEQLRTEATERATEGAKGAGMLVAAGATGTVALAATASLPIIALRRVLPGWAIALLIAGGAGAATAVLARRGLSELGSAAPINTDRIKDAARDAVHSIT